jgi:hypothetical protein
MRKIQLLYFDGCPSHAQFLPRLQAVIDQADVAADVELLRVESLETAVAERFLGSPSVRVDGRDIEPGADERTDYGLKCRLYPTPRGLQGTPPEEHLLAALTGEAHGHADRSA